MSEPPKTVTEIISAVNAAPPAPAAAIVIEPSVISLKEFLENVPPGQMRRVLIDMGDRGTYAQLSPPQLRLHCGQPPCGGERLYFTKDDPAVQFGHWGNYFLNYQCRNCGVSAKGYSLRIVWPKPSDAGVMQVTKFGEIPEFGAPLSDALTKLVEADRPLLQKGYKSENQGLGVAANAYYRRVVENQKNAILLTIRKVAEQEGAEADILADIDAALGERQFQKAIESMKHGIPKSLRIDGHDPLRLLHDELSVGIHELSDEECLERAHHIRVVLADLADRAQQALKDRRTVRESLAALLKKQRERSTK